MPKVKPFGIGDVEDLVNAKNEFNSEVVPKSVYQFKVKRMVHGTIRKEGPNKGKSRFSILLEVVGPKKTPKKYIGAGVWSSINVIDSGAGNCNDFINALAGPDEKAQAALRKAFWTPDITVDKDGNVKKIGRKVIGSPDGQLIVTGRTKMGKDNDGNPRAEIAAFLLPKSSEDDEDDEDFDEEELDEDDVDEDEDEDADDDEDEEDEDDEDEEDDEEDEDDEESELREELEELSAVALRKRAKANGSSAADVKGKSEEELVDLIVSQEIEEDVDEDEDEEDDDEDDDDEDDDDEDDDEDDEAESELREELGELGVVALRKRAKESGATVAETKGKDKEALIDLIVEKELDDEDDGEGEEEPF